MERSCVERARPAWYRKWSEAPSLLAQASATVSQLRGETSIVWLGSDNREEVCMSFGTMWERTTTVMRYLTEQGVATKGDRVLLCMSPGPTFFWVMLACLRGGIVAVPVYPPNPSRHMQRGLDKLQLLRENCQANACCCDKDVDRLRRTTSVLYDWPSGLAWVNCEGMTEVSSGSVVSALGRAISADHGFEEVAASKQLETNVDEDHIAFLQYTSGSTGEPKGVMLSHRNLWHNVNELYIPTLERGAALDDRTTEVSVLMFLGPFVGGWKMIHTSPLIFLADPLGWLKTMSTYKVHWSASPDFGFDLCVRRLSRSPADFLESIDLSSILRLGAGVGQRCRPDQLRTFYDTVAAAAGIYAPFERFFMPAYGLAEHVVGTSFELDGIVSSKTIPSLVSSGSQFLCDISIVDPETRTVVTGDAMTGELWISGSDSEARGYWGKPELSEETFRARAQNEDDDRSYLRTGDLAFVEDGHLFICGRLKDLIIVGGCNYYPEDCEIAADKATAGVGRPGCIAAFAIENLEDNGEETLALVFEVYEHTELEAADAAQRAASAVFRDVGLNPARVVAIKEKSIPKTTSGKIRRRATRDALREGTLSIVFDTAAKLADASPRSNETRPILERMFSWLSAASPAPDGDTESLVSIVTPKKKPSPYSKATAFTFQETTPELLRPSVNQSLNNKTGRSWTSLKSVRETVLAACNDDDDDDEKKSTTRVLPSPLSTLEDIAAASSSSGGGGQVVRETLDAVRHKLLASPTLEWTADELARSIEVAFVEVTLVFETRRRAVAREINSKTCVFDVGLSSMELVGLRDTVTVALDVDVKLELLLRATFPISSLAEEIVATVEAISDEARAEARVASGVFGGTCPAEGAAALEAYSELADLGDDRVFPYALSRFERATTCQVIAFCLWLPCGIMLAAVRLCAFAALVASTSPVSCLRHLHFIIGLRLTALDAGASKSSTNKRTGSGDVEDDDEDDELTTTSCNLPVSDDEPTLVLVNHHVTPDLFFVVHALLRRAKAPLVPVVLAHDKLASFYRISGLGGMVELASGTTVLERVEAWKEHDEARRRPMVLAPHGQTLRAPFISPPMKYWLTQDVRTVVASTILANNPFNMELRVVGGSLLLDFLLFLAMPTHRATIHFDLVRRGERQLQAEEEDGKASPSWLRAWGNVVTSRGLTVTPWSPQLKSRVVSGDSSPRELNDDHFETILGHAAARNNQMRALVVVVERVLRHPGNTSVINRKLDTLLTSYAARFDLVVVQNGKVGIDVVDYFFAKLVPTVSVTLSPYASLAETVEGYSPDVVFVASLEELPRGLLATRRAAVVVVNPSDADRNTAEAFGLSVLRAPEGVASWWRSLNQFEANIIARIQRWMLRSCVTQIFVSWVHWIFAEEQVIVLGCVLAAARQSPDLVISVGRAYTITHAWACYVPKLFFARPRPFWLENNHVKFACSWDLSVHDNSFPSGHAAFVATIAATCWNFGAVRITSLVTTCLAVVAAFARVAAGVHYPSDVVVGATGAVVLNYLVFWPLGLLERSRGPKGFMVRDEELVNRQLGATAAVTAVNAIGILFAFLFAKVPPMTDRIAWTRTHSSEYQKHVDAAGVNRSVQLIDSHKKIESAVTALFAASITVFWTTALTREPKHAAAAILISIASVVLFLLTRGYARRTKAKNNRGCFFVIQTVLIAVLLFFNLVVVDVIIFKLFENEKMKCISGFRGSDFRFENFDSYPTYFREDSTLTLAQAGTYQGPEDIEEYMRYASHFSPFFSFAALVKESITFKSFDVDAGICQFVTVQTSDYITNPNVALATRVNATSLAKIYYDSYDDYFPRVDVYYSRGLVNFLFEETLNTQQTREFICGVMADNCTFTTRSMAECVADLDALPTFSSNYSHVDGNSEACRDLHGVFARDDPENHCPHISFEPMVDPKGRIKCQNSSNMLPSDLFDDFDIDFYENFCEDNGVDPDQGYVVDAAW
ncbi:hypothetical protein CTAYLR_004055 [Chrysophaeum taylorii]|uniref:Phosphatidic acid phosphatase type 2/haloperoxidase domain-containing protein n=1 Tax=Chrysophaeum taylorii TaxID=2483200 RepID=A0AAD7UNG6_9STRA|nr:hypothetical protein CTAYLR_004055 [Chrysophaeum taylorii]